MPLQPVNAEDLARLHELQVARANISERLLTVELEKVRLLAAGRRISEEQETLFRRIANERGLPERVAMDVNPRTGEIVLEPTTPESTTGRGEEVTPG